MGLVLGLIVGKAGVASSVGAHVGAATGTTFIIAALKFAKLIEPNPVAGSHPEVAKNPSLQHGKPDDKQRLSPLVMSFAKLGEN